MSNAWKRLRDTVAAALVVWMTAAACSTDQQGALGVYCTHDDECASGRCSNENECVSCVLDEDCASGERCAGGACRARVLCISNSECEAALDDPVCSPRGFCVECVSPEDCGGAPCLSGVCGQVDQCHRAADCPTGKVCHPERGYCVDCLSDSHCAANEACLEQSCVQRCSPDDECPLNQHCDPSRQLCVDCLVDADCPAAYHCKLGSCRKDICGPKTTSCIEESNATLQCAPDGRSQIPTFCPLNTSCTIGDGVAHCAERICKPGETQCTDDGSAVRVCNDDGLSWSDALVDCAQEGGVCLNGTCKDVVCTPGERRCQANRILVCNSSGTILDVESTCLSSQFCNANTTTCSDKVCISEAPICDGNVATTCKADGSGTEPNGTDCSETGQACHAGECKDIVCDGSWVCDGKARYACVDNGTRLTFLQTCLSHQYCDPSVNFCVSQICTPGELYCSGNSIATCNSEGSGSVGPTTSCGDQVCVSATCLDKICEPHSYFCDGKNVMRCGSDGTTSSVHRTCTASQFCEEGSSQCHAQVCTPDAPTCNGSQLSTCASNGSGPIDSGAPCPDGQTCASHACRDIICEPLVRYCRDGDGGNVYLCNATGTDSSLVTTCQSTHHCNHESYDAVCALDICVASQPACDGETLATCNATGSGFVDQNTDCSATSQVCVRTGCADSDTFSAGTQTSSSNSNSSLYVHRYPVTTTRQLSEIEAYLGIAGTTQLEWVVYECALNSSCTKIYSKLTQSTGTTYHSSGAVENVSLTAGATYAIGVRVVGTHTNYRSTLTQPQSASFGLWRGATQLSAPNGLATINPFSWSNTAYSQRITTLPKD